MPDTGPVVALELVSSADLIEELCRRYDALVLMAYQDRADGGYRVCRRYYGGPILTTGLIARCWMELQEGAYPCSWESPPSQED